MTDQNLPAPLFTPPPAEEMALRITRLRASVSAVAVDVTDSQVLLEQNADIVLPIASITKLMTALVVLESGTDLDEWLTIEDWDRKTAKNAYSRIRLASSARRRDLCRCDFGVIGRNHQRHARGRCEGRQRQHGRVVGVADADAEASAAGVREVEQEHWILPRLQHAGSDHSRGHGEVRGGRIEGEHY